MITAINSANSFKAIYKPDKKMFTTSQQRVAEDMEARLGFEAVAKDFSIEPYGQNHVALFSVEGANKNPLTGQYSFDKKVLCSICDEFNPLNVKNIELAKELHLNAEATLAVIRDIFIATLASAALIGGALAIRNKINTAKAQTEIVQKADTINNLVKKLK